MPGPLPAFMHMKSSRLWEFSGKRNDWLFGMWIYDVDTRILTVRQLARDSG